MDKQQIIDSFEAYNIKLYPAGIWKFVDGKKTPIVAFRTDGLPLDSYPKDNMFKLRIDETPYMVIDVDGGDILELYKRFPSLKTTLTTTTTAKDKFHIYIQRPEEFPLTRIVGAMNKIDILSNGIVFEGHLYDVNPLYDIEGNKIVELTDTEVSDLLSLVPQGIKYSDGHKIVNRRSNPGEKQMVEEYLNDTLKDPRRLWKALTPKNEQKQGKKEYDKPELSYDVINTMGYFLALNEYIPHEMVIQFLEKFLVKEYDISLSSTQTQQRLYKQIIPTLPVYEIDETNDSFETHIASAPESSNGLFKLLATTDSTGNLRFVLIDKYSHVPQQLNGNIMRTQKAVQYLYPTLDSDMWTYGVARTMVELTADPYKPQKGYDFTRNVFTLSMLRPTEYMLNLGMIDTKPSNILTKAIEGIFRTNDEATSSVDPEDFYYHWLAHILFSDKQMSTILSLSTDATVQGGTGKSTFTSKLPMHILPRGTVFAVDEGTAGWGDAYADSKLTCFDDLHDTDKWKKIYTDMKRETSGTIKKANLKGRGTQIQEKSACLSISSNFIPKIDETDRRFFIWSPTEKLSVEEGLQISSIISNINGYSQEIQDITDYCNYLYTNFKEKYSRELYIEAPTTSFNGQAKIEGATSEKLLSMIKHGPDALFDAFVPNKKNKMTQHEIVEFLLNQAGEPSAKSNGKYTMHLPQDFFVILLNATRDDDVTNQSPKKIAFMIGATFTVINKAYTSYRDTKLGCDWATRGLRLLVDENTINKYKMWLKYNATNTEIVTEEVAL